MIAFSTRTKNVVKPALAVVIAYGISLGMGWENPYWAGFAVAMISLSTAGQSLNKGAMRMLGTLVAALVSLSLTAWFAQDRWWFIAILSIYIGFCTYMIAGSKHQYFWYCCAFVCLVICVHAAGQPTNAFSVAVLRVQQTGMGILVYTLVSIFLWPTSSRGVLDETTGKLFEIQAALYRSYSGLLNGRGAIEDSQPLRLQEVQLLTQRAQDLNAAETDSYEVWEARHQWHRFHRQSTSLMEALERWRTSFNEIQSLDLTRLLPNLAAVLSEIDDRFAEIERILIGEAGAPVPKSISLVVDQKEIHNHSHFQKAAVAVTKTQLDRIEALSRALLDCILDIKGDGRPSQKSVSQATRPGGFSLDQDRLIAAARATGTLWAAFLIWFYIDPPGHTSFVEVAVIIAMGAAMAHMSPAVLFLPFVGLTLSAGILYIFVMPHLSGFTQLGVMIFAATWTVYYLFWQPRQGLAKAIGAAMFLNVISVQNQQTYNFTAFATSVVMIQLAVGLAILIWYIPPSPRPEKAFLRLLLRFYRHSEHLLSRMALDWEQKRNFTGRWKTLLYQNDLLELPQKLSVLGGQVDHRFIVGATPEQVRALVNSLGALALRLKDLVDSRELPQAPLLVRELLEDIRAWRLATEALFLNWSNDPGSEPDGNIQNRLKIRLKDLEGHISRTLNLAEQDEISENDYKNFYRLIGCYRGLSEAVIVHAKLAGSFDWAEWKEARF